MKLLAVFLLLVQGCVVHHLQPVSVLPEPTITITVMPDREGCEVDRNVFFWLGDDGMMGWGRNCELAHQDWMKNMPPTRSWRL